MRLIQLFFRGAKWCFICVVLLLSLGPTPTTANNHFNFDKVAELARRAAGESFKAPPLVPDFLSQISYDDYRDIRFDSGQSLWKDGGTRFQVQFIHPGLYYRHAVTINVVNGGGVHKVPFSPKSFTYGKNKFADKVPGDLGFAGFRLAYPLYKKDDFNHVIVFAGASYFRAVAKNQVFGLSARGLAVDTGLPSGEEFPFFREFWLERPSRDDRTMKIYALLDSDSVTGAYEFIVQPGDRTVVSVRAKLFQRKRAQELGIAPLTSMFLYGEEKPRPAGDWRPEVHDSDGLLIASAAGEWIWRPLVNPQKLRLSYFELDNPRGFGLLQRDRNFSDYQDLETHHERRPNAWIVPTGNWGKGQIKLVEIPSQKETNDNIVAYWIPRTLPQPGQPIELAYKIFFQTEDPLEVPAGRTTATRIGVGDKEEWRRFVIDFDGGKLRALSGEAAMQAVVSLGPDGQLVQKSVTKNQVTQGWRLAFQIKPPPDKPLEMRVFLQHNKDVLTETWSYLLDP